MVRFYFYNNSKINAVFAGISKESFRENSFSDITSFPLVYF